MQPGLMSILLCLPKDFTGDEVKMIIQKTVQTTGYLGGFWAASPSYVVNFAFS